MKPFFKVTDLPSVLKLVSGFEPVETESIALLEATGRILATDIFSEHDLPGFARATMDGFAVRAASTFGASEANPAYLTVAGEVAMGESPSFTVGTGQVSRISTGGMLPKGTDAVIMVEHTETLDDTTIEAYRSVAPGQHVITVGEDFLKDETILTAGQNLRPQETGLLAAFGHRDVTVYRRPIVGIISTGDEIVPINQLPQPGQIRDINSYSLSGQVQNAGGVPIFYGIVADDYPALLDMCQQAIQETDMVLLSGGSSVGMRDFTIEVLSNLPDTEILVHGISISPGKPTILARSSGKAVWGLPGQVVSAMVVFKAVVLPFCEHVAGLIPGQRYLPTASARLDRSLASAQGRTDFVRVRLYRKDGSLQAEPILGKSGLINTMVKADGLIQIDINTEGLDKDTMVAVIPL